MVVRRADLDSPTRRPLYRGLNLSVSAGDRVALIGRNGVGKSTLLELLAGGLQPDRGAVSLHTRPTLVQQDPSSAEALGIARRLLARARDEPTLEGALAREFAEAGLRPPRQLLGQQQLSRGEVRKLHLIAAKLGPGELLLLDEPSEDLDAAGVAWLQRWLASWRGALIVASHSRPLLRGFEHFFIVSESGCRHLSGSFAQLEQQLAQEQDDHQRRYAEHLRTLADAERHHHAVNQRRRRKKNVGRLHELRRCTSRCRLNEKRSYAQESQAKAAKIRHERISAARGWAKSTRRALTVQLPLLGFEVGQGVPALTETDGGALISLTDVGVELGGRRLFNGMNIAVGRERVALLGPNGSGKTTLLQVMLGARAPTIGAARCRLEAIGSIAQGASDWISDDSLLDRLFARTRATSLDEAAQLLIAHRFPLALAERPLASLSPGERVRAALICLFRQQPTLALLVLDEPTFSLDLVGLSALQAALRAWPGGLVVASHDLEFLDAIGTQHAISFDGHGGHTRAAFVGRAQS
ncbi:ABC transporter ATP-binding protein [Enhygromyxa salina]|uniref:ABC transporter ATP-binding protein n=1 Tax=Enhygromyxa salina TaxID=215803 RepID=A0A0C1ZB07_9BACT|nr:ABC transporter ATP-binding protein [Enhygromyxa salina]